MKQNNTMYLYANIYTIDFFSDEEDDDSQDDLDWREDSDTGEDGGGRARSPVSGTSGNRGRGRRGRARAGRGRPRAGRGRARAGRGRARAGRGRARAGWTPSTSSKSYDDADTRNDLPPFQPNRPQGIHFGRQVLRGGMTTALEFFRLFFTSEMIRSVVAHTNSYAYMKLVAGGYTTYTIPEEV